MAKINEKVLELIKKNVELSYKDFINKTKVNINSSTFSYYAKKYREKKRNVAPKEVIEFVKENNDFSYNTCKLIVLEKFDFEICPRFYKRYTGNQAFKSSRLYTDEQIIFLKQNYLKKNVVELFNKEFRTNKTQQTLNHKLQKMGLFRSKEIDKFLLENSNLTCNELKHKYNETFGTHYTREEMWQQCYRRGIHLPKPEKCAIYLDNNKFSKDNMVYVDPVIACAYTRYTRNNREDFEINESYLKVCELEYEVRKINKER